MTQDVFGCRGNTIKVAAGHYFDLADPRPEMVDIASIATPLSRICRFGGHCPQFYSVAEHCVHAYDLAKLDGVKGDALKAVLLHDATEAYLGDMVKPLKILSQWYAEIESRVEKIVGTKFAVDFSRWSDVVKRYDQIMLKAEKTSFWPDDKTVWHGFESVPIRPVKVRFFNPDRAAEEFLFRCCQLEIAI